MDTKKMKIKALPIIICTKLLLAFFVFLIGCQAQNNTNSAIYAAATTPNGDYDFSTGKIYVANGRGKRTISMANLDGSGGVSLGTIHTFLRRPDKIIIDSIREKIYFLNAAGGVIKANLDGSEGIETYADLINESAESWAVVHTDCIVIDPLKAKIYIGSIKSKKINGAVYINRDDDPTVIIQANLDGSDKKFIAQDILKKIDPQCMYISLEAVDPKRGTIYLTSNTRGLFKARLDTSEVTKISSKLCSSYAIDSENEKIYSIYWGVDTDNPSEPSKIPQNAMKSLENLKDFVNSKDESKKCYILRTNLDGKELVNLGDIGGLLDEPSGIALDTVNKKMYIANRGNNRIIRANLDGAGAENLGNLNGTVDYPRGIAVLPPGVAGKPKDSKK